jgi:hypothetical protein
MPEHKTPKGWTAVKCHFKDWDAAQFVALVKDLYDSSSANRTFIEARTQAAGNSGAALEIYRERIIEQFFPKRGFGKLKLAEARKAIREYKKATGNVEGTLELLMTYLENGNEFTCQYGDISESFYDSLCSVMDEISAMVEKAGPTAYTKVAHRLDRVAAKADGIGWGYSDHISCAVDALADRFEKE